VSLVSYLDVANYLSDHVDIGTLTIIVKYEQLSKFLVSNFCAEILLQCVTRKQHATTINSNINIETVFSRGLSGRFKNMLPKVLIDLVL